jgi:uncharacterized cupin superfamily protein
MYQNPGMSDDNIWTSEWDGGEDWSGGGGNAKRLPRAERPGATVYEISPGNFDPYHFHHASEEMLIVLDGEMTMKTEEGARTVRRGRDLPGRACRRPWLRNAGEGPCRYLMASSRRLPEVAEYPELGQIAVQGPSASQTGEGLWFIYDVPKPGDE